MNPIVRNILVVLAAVLVGSTINMAIILVSGSIIPPPEGADLTSPEGLAAALPFMQPKHFLMPFLAHALGTFAGAFLAVKLVASHPMKFALGIGIYFLAGGIAACFMIPAPLWFMVADLVLAYIPVAYLAALLGIKKA